MAAHVHLQIDEEAVAVGREELRKKERYALEKPLRLQLRLERVHQGFQRVQV